ncbi:MULTISPECIES: hypothetical protein [unclassified Synechocystis]|uniref:DUF6930 domain-containing protein n=1 Tax=unclassified Synechocystis TaxID=2640012 RepID=UPI0004D14B9B|nr:MULTISPECIES: hypothetical protein [unclassified Synechocystis]AIE75208.1 hypothetical protein D082_26800 [Synechocystis sp. PCC 6714]
MTSSLPSSTQHRLQQLPQIPSVWEGDRRPFNGGALGEREEGEGGECILWVDGSEGLVRSMDVIPETAGMETVVRTLIRAMEMPRSPAPPCRPKKIVVRNRELQFLLRGILQGLNISVEYQAQLPLIDELFRTFDTIEDRRPEPIPAKFDAPLKKLAREIWHLAPWEVLTDLDILAIEIPSLEEVPPLYACVMGMLGEEYGIILYRSLDSLKAFREMAMGEDNNQSLEQIFLVQDCWFINYEQDFQGRTIARDNDPFLPVSDDGETMAIFGSIHPLEGIRPFIDEGEALAIYCALEGLAHFVKAHYSYFESEDFDLITEEVKVKHPLKPRTSKERLVVRLSTQPDLTAEFLLRLGFDNEDDEDEDDLLEDDLIPDNSYMSLGMVPWELVQSLRSSPVVYYQAGEFRQKGDGMPVLMIQTSRPKAKDLIRRLQQEGEIAGLGFNEGQDPWTETKYDLGILKTGADKLFLFGEFLHDAPAHRQAKKNWERRCRDTKGYCAVLIAMGVTGQSKGRPELRHMLGYFETRFLTPKELGLGPLRMSLGVDFDMD